MPFGNNAFVRRLEKLVNLSPADREILANLGTGGQLVGPGEDLINESRGPVGAILLLEGFACRYRLGPKGDRQITDYLLPGDLAMLETSVGNKLDAIGAMTASSVVNIPVKQVAELMSFPTIARALRKTTVVGEATVREWLVNMGRRSAEERLAHLFCELNYRMEVVGKASNGSFGLPLTQFDIGDTVGLSYVHVNRTLQSLRRRNLIKLQSKVLTILDFAGLKLLAGFNPYYLEG